MTSLLHPPSRLLFPTFTRESISWRTASSGIVEIAIDLENPGSKPTSPGDLVVETAAFGAFIPFRPVTRIALGSLEPGERRRVTTQVARSRLATTPPMPANIGASLAEAIRATGVSVKPEVLDLVGRTQWGGNLNVYFDRRPEDAVEVHRAFELRVRAGQPILLAIIPVSEERFSVDFRISVPEWTAQTVELFSTPFVVIQPGLAVGQRAQVTIEVTRRSDRKMVPVELALETVAGDGTSLGCVSV